MIHSKFIYYFALIENYNKRAKNIFQMWDEYSHNSILEEHIPCNCSHKPGVISELKKEDHQCVFSKKREVKYHKGEIILKQDTTLTHVACIKSGFVKQYIEGDNGKNVTYKILTKGDIIGFSEILTEKPIVFNIAAISEVVTCLIPVKNVMETMSKNPKMTMNILKYNNKTNQDIFRYVINLSQRSMLQRVAGLLLYFVDVFQEVELELPISRQELADMCSMTKESFIRTLKKLKDEKIIKVDGNTVTILKKNDLVRIKDDYK